MISGQASPCTVGLILAAGQSSRFGGMKQLARVGGEPLLLRVVKAALASALDRTILVLGFGAGEIIRELGDELTHPALSVVTNMEWQEGMATSLRAGMARAMCPSLDSIMIILGDLPLLNSRMIDLVLKAYRISGKGICLPVRDGRWGHPICLSSRYFDALMLVEGDQGARDIIRRNWSQVHQFDTRGNECFLDVDTRYDIDKLDVD